MDGKNILFLVFKCNSNVQLEHILLMQLALFAKDGRQLVELAMRIVNPNAYRQVEIVSFESTKRLTIHKESTSMPNVIFSLSYHDLVYTKMECLDYNGGLKLISPTFDEHQSMLLQELQHSIQMEGIYIYLPTKLPIYNINATLYVSFLLLNKAMEYGDL